MTVLALYGISPWIWIAGGTIIGTIWGSFIGALCTRWPDGRSIMTGRSHCDHCGKQLDIAELVPVISYLLQHGRCRSCATPIGKMNLGIEITAGLIGFVAFSLLAVQNAICFSVFGWLILPLIILDHRHLWLPDKLTFILAVIGPVAGMLLRPEYDIWFQITAAITGFLVMEIVRRGYYLIRKHDGMGSGDPKLFAAIALWLPPQLLPMTMVFACGIGIIWLITQRRDQDLTQVKLPLGTLMGIAAIPLYGFWLA